MRHEQRAREWRRLGALLALALLIGPPAGGESGEPGDLERIRQAIEASRERVSLYEREERGLLEALDAIEESAELLQRDVVRARLRARCAREELTRSEAQAAKVSERLGVLERAMGARARALYRAGELGAIPLLFSAGDLREFLSRVQALRLLLSHDADLLARHRSESEALQARRADAARAASQSRAAQALLEERSRQLGEEQERKRELVMDRKYSRTRERSALAELEIAGRALEEAVAAMPAQPQAAFAPKSGSFSARRGRLPAPVDAPIARGYGRVLDGESRTATFRKGVEYAAPEGAPVRAVAPGGVRFAGRFRGYGKTVILDHGDGYFTVSSHLAETLVAVGAFVEAGDLIGRVGDTGSLAGPQLYFEMRRGGEALDPQDWLAGTPASRR
ncbi:MAG TPA: peptidoglycan DD-metalloendopeptidase family protein [Myxococcota bacterium]|nr:peptidoglycan DD-metalloendopeptidase family protein [Myxococcota bacterium]